MTDLKESDLHITFDEVERSDGHVSETVAEDPAGRAGGVEGQRVHLDLLAGLAGGRNEDVAPPRRRRSFEERPAPLLLGFAPSIIFSSVVEEERCRGSLGGNFGRIELGGNFGFRGKNFLGEMSCLLWGNRFKWELMDGSGGGRRW